MAGIGLIIFDMGGVLLRTENHDGRKALADRFGLTPENLYALVFGSSSAARAEVGEISEHAHWEWIGQQLGLDAAGLADVEKAWWDGDRIDIELMQAIQRLRQSYRTALLSNAWSGARAGVQRYFDFSAVFDLIVFSAEIGMRKPDEKAFHYVLNHFGVQPSEAVFVDDYEPNIVAARQLGIHTVHFLNREQALADLARLVGHSVG